MILKYDKEMRVYLPFLRNGISIGTKSYDGSLLCTYRGGYTRSFKKGFPGLDKCCCFYIKEQPSG